MIICLLDAIADSDDAIGNLRETSTDADDVIWFCILVDDSGTRLQPNPTLVLGHQPICDQAGASCLDHCNARH